MVYARDRNIHMVHARDRNINTMHARDRNMRDRNIICTYIRISINTLCPKQKILDETLIMYTYVHIDTDLCLTFHLGGIMWVSRSYLCVRNINTNITTGTSST